MPWLSRWARSVHASWAAAVVPWIYRNPDEGLYHRHWIVLSVLLSGVLLYSLWKRKPVHFHRLAESVSGSAQPAC